MLAEPNRHLFEEEVFLFPASFAQQRLWFVEQFAPGTALYNVPLVFRLNGTLNRVALQQSFDELVQRHEALRTTFHLLDGQLHQAIAPNLEIALPLIDLRELPATNREAEAQRLLWQEMQRSFNLSEVPLVRLLLLQLDEREHILQINLHHIVFDEWSSGVLIRELTALYTGLVNGDLTTLPNLPIQYADFAHWQRQWLQGDVLESQLDYWRSQLQEVPVLDLPSDHPRPPTQSHRGAIQLLELPQQLLDALEDLSQQAEVTLFMTLLAAFQTLLYRYSGQTDIAIGSPIANRHRSELEGLIGFFVNSLVLRTDLSGNPTFRELLDRVREVTLGAYAHQDLPFEKLVEELHPNRQTSRNPLFQVTFALQNTPMEQLELPDLTLSSNNFETRTTRFDLELYLWTCADNFRSLWGQGWKHSEGLRGVIVYNTDLFEPDTIDRLRQHFQVLLAGIAANPDTELADLPLLTPSEQRQILIDWNDTKTHYPANQCIQLQFEHQVRQTPNAIAVQFGNNQFTYQDLNRGSNQLAHYLQKLGVDAEAPVGICMERSAEAIAAMLGILKAGGAYVPLDPGYPSERLQFILQDAQVSVVLTHQRWAEALDGSDITVICLDQAWEAIAQESEENLTSQSSADSLAYVIYTSGSTGTPKGVAVPHRAVLRLVCNTNYVTLETTDKIAQVSNLAFDAATFEVWGALLNGAQLIGLDRTITLTPQDFATQLQQQQITVLFLTTALFNQMARESPTAFRSLKYLLFGGELVDPRWVREVLQQGAPQQLLHVYGPTENTTFSSWYRVRSLPENATTLPIGRAIANTQIYLLDAHLNPVPIGVTGEIYLGGDGLAKGYLNRPELTAERFIPNPFKQLETPSPSSPLTPHPSLLTPPSLPLYKTGDLARYLPDGNIEFLGRVDDQIKIRGFRIELGEIESVLVQHSAVQAAVVVVRQVETDRRLIAYLVCQHPTPSHSNLRNFLKSKLPEYMVPSVFVHLETLPLTSNGKVNRQALPIAAVVEPEFTNAEVVPAIAPRTSVEVALAEMWKTLLGREQVGVESNFFELGGHSLLATQLISRIRSTFRVEVPLQRLFETPTIADLAQYIETLDWARQQHHSSDPPINDAGQTRQPREEVEL